MISEPKPGTAKPFYGNMMFVMVVAIVAGIAAGLLFPSIGVYLNNLPAIFIKLVRMVVGLVIFVTVALGVAKLGNFREVGRLAIVSLIYFEVMTTVAFAWGTLVGNLVEPGSGLHIDPKSVNASAISGLTSQAQQHRTAIDFFVGLVPSNPVTPFLDNNIIQVLILALFVGFAIASTGSYRESLINALTGIEKVVFVIIGYIMKVAPLAVFGAMAFVTSNYGLTTIASLAKLVLTIYGACIVFIVVAFGIVAKICKISLWKLVVYLKEEMVLAFATASGESVLPRLVAKMEIAGCAAPTVGFVLPTGYSFNLDGGSIYLTITSLFIAQAFDVHLSLTDQLAMIGIFLLTSKGIAGVAGAGMVVLASSLLMMPQIPLVGLALALSVDRLSDPIRTVTNVLGNALATMFVAWWAGERDEAQVSRALSIDRSAP
jgi:aerobic C4-dicarboxylate transport protein